MRKLRFMENQVVGVLRQVDAGAKVEDACREHGISSATYYNWKPKCKCPAFLNSPISVNRHQVAKSSDIL